MGRCPGAFAEYALMDAREAIPVPANLAWEEAAAIPLVFMVVHDMLIAQGRLGRGEWLLSTMRFWNCAHRSGPRSCCRGKDLRTTIVCWSTR